MTDATALAPRQANTASEVLSKLPKPSFARMKIISMGDEATGKSCIIKRFCEERFIPKYISTIGIDYGVKRVTVDGTEVRVNFWDLAGGQEFFEIRNEFYKDAQGAILVYDVTNARSFAQLDLWLKEATKFGAKDLVIAVCANKVDLPKRVVTEAEGRKWATTKGFAYFEMSASTGLNIVPMFEQLLNDTYLLRK
jgi:DnaJ family protein C protein 27